MEPETYQVVQQREDLWRFIRNHPEWYRYLTRDPNRLKELELTSKQFYGKTMPPASAKNTTKYANVKFIDANGRLLERLRDCLFYFWLIIGMIDDTEVLI
ncbi:hypothetical protein JCM21714_719 [Gracilibacillus boraciitolerans JCM 21714]|uniref:YlbE-like protein n=1 Tax=Gracilibacillus boraciitolerans JCM 21714 TaxID=1298598 RepID=W4VG20_9BACI|nr:YlbE-like family protein [Gracilibacillus boraciitolerans]GAE91763.1 hypothetical protein JCM21714_719 [Gracilibacillus boraciitolerans JCM 21714]